MSSQYRHVLFIVSLHWPFFRRQSARLKMKPWKGPRQCLELCSFLNLSMFLSIVGQAGQKGYPDHSQGHGGLRGATICQSYSCLIDTPGNMMSKHLEMFGTFPLLFNLVFAQEVKSSRKRHFLFWALYPILMQQYGMQSTARSKRSGRPRFSTMRPGFHDNLVP